MIFFIPKESDSEEIVEERDDSGFETSALGQVNYLLCFAAQSKDNFAGLV